MGMPSGHARRPRRLHARSRRLSCGGRLRPRGSGARSTRVAFRSPCTSSGFGCRRAQLLTAASSSSLAPRVRRWGQPCGGRGHGRASRRARGRTRWTSSEARGRREARRSTPARPREEHARLGTPDGRDAAPAGSGPSFGTIRRRLENDGTSGLRSASARRTSSKSPVMSHVTCDQQAARAHGRGRIVRVQRDEDDRVGGQRNGSEGGSATERTTSATRPSTSDPSNRCARTLVASSATQNRSSEKPRSETAAVPAPGRRSRCEGVGARIRRSYVRRLFIRRAWRCQPCEISRSPRRGTTAMRSPTGTTSIEAP
jgi:hypothetical protein